MSNFHIHRTHVHGFTKIRKIAFTWAELLEKEFGLCCVYLEGETEDEVLFTRAGVKGRLVATHDNIEITVELGAFLQPFKSSVQKKILKNLDLLLI